MSSRPLEAAVTPRMMRQVVTLAAVALAAAACAGPSGRDRQWEGVENALHCAPSTVAAGQTFAGSTEAAAVAAFIDAERRAGFRLRAQRWTGASVGSSTDGTAATYLVFRTLYRNFTGKNEMGYGLLTVTQQGGSFHAVLDAFC